MLMLVLAVFTAASTALAQDTLRIQSYRLVDVCSNERRWLLAVNVGTIRTNDSLVSFDITIGYDRTKLRPTDVLKEGTLSAGMAYEPFLNTVVPNEMRIAGGNIIKTVQGDVPLVAVAGDFLGDCMAIDTLGYPWPATFNSEFKKRFTVVRFDTVKAIAKAKSNFNSGIRSNTESLTIASGERFIDFTVVGSQLKADSTPYRFRFKNSNGKILLVNGADVKGLIDVQESQTSDGLVVQARSTQQQPEITIRYEITSASRPDSATVIMSTEDLSDCTCERSTLIDTVSIKINPTVSVSSTDERIEAIIQQNDAVHVQCDHEEMKTVQVYSLAGQLIETITLNKTDTVIATSSLSAGSYVVRVICGNHQHVKMILK